MTKIEIIRMVDEFLKASIISSAVTAAKALITYDKNFWKIFRQHIAGILFGATIGYIMRDVKLSTVVHGLIIAGCAISVTSLLPLLENLFLQGVNKLGKKKIDSL